MVEQQLNIFPQLLTDAGQLPGPRATVTSNDSLPPLPIQVLNQIEQACSVDGYF